MNSSIIKIIDGNLKVNHIDFVRGIFAPAVGIDEDPVTGSAHSVLTPFWSHRLNKIHLTALQVSARGGELSCKISGDRIEIGEKAITYLVGEIDAWVPRLTFFSSSTLFADPG